MLTKALRTPPFHNGLSEGRSGLLTTPYTSSTWSVLPEGGSNSWPHSTPLRFLKLPPPQRVYLCPLTSSALLPMLYLLCLIKTQQKEAIMVFNDSVKAFQFASHTISSSP